MSDSPPAGRAGAKRILFVLRGAYLPGVIDGANISLHALCRRLARIGFEPIVVCASDPPGNPAAPAPRAHGLGYSVIRLPEPLKAVGEMSWRLEPAAIVLRNAVSAAQAAEMARSLARPLHLYLSGGLFGERLPPREAAPLLRFAANSRFLVRVSELLLDRPVACVPSIVEPDEYRCVPSGDAILFVNPIAAKGVHVAAAVARRLSHRRFLFLRSWLDHPSYRLVDVQLPNVEWLASTLDMRPVFARTKLVLMPSVLDESFGRTVAEAQVSGIPAVVSDRGGLPDTLGQGGVVVPITAPIERWCEAVEGLLNDPARYAALSQSATRHAARPETAPERIVAQFVEFAAS
ncbi:MAG TPA: glycosyltransferase [Alphaproteobacteria bacterium]|jgi:glycosyltransferase involved in cell wall biosynthesis